MAEKTTEVERLLTRARQDTDVLAVLLFGSAARQEQTPRSDIDVCLVLVPPGCRERRQINSYERAFLSHKRLAYLTDFDLDLHIFQQLPLYIRRRVLKEGRVLFVRDEDLLSV